jgi:hypothetical protein
LYYADKKIPRIRNDLDKYFKKHSELDMENVIKYFDGKYSESELRNSLKAIIDKSGSNKTMYYNDYMSIYSRSEVKDIMIGISRIFLTHFRKSFSYIKSKFPDNTEYEILTALKNIIDESIIIKNKYGFTSYLKEDNNIYFLVNSLSVENNSFSNYYSRIPNIINDDTFLDILTDVQIKNLPVRIKTICKNSKKETFSKLIKTIPDEVQEMFIETAIAAEVKGVNHNKNIRQLVLDYFVNYIHKIDDNDMWVSDKGEQLRCFEDDIWKDCDKKYDNILEEKMKDRKSTLEKNPWGYYGQRNPETGVFSIVNIITQKEKQQLLKDKEKAKLDKLVKANKLTEEERDEQLNNFIAGREVYPGRNCRKGWGVSSLLRIAIKVIKLEYPDNFKKNVNSKKLRKEIISNKYLSIGTVKDPAIYSKGEINDMTNDDMRRALYWTTKKTGGYTNVLCTEIEKWFKNTKWNGMDMLIPDKQGGTSGGHIKISSTAVVKKQPLNTVTIVPEQNEDKFKTYLKDIQKVMGECLKIKKYVPVDDDKKWILVFSRKKLVSIIVINTDNNTIVNACVATNYKRKGLGKQFIQKALENEDKLQLIVDNRGKDYKKKIILYTDYGFVLVKNDGKQTLMEFNLL